MRGTLAPRGFIAKTDPEGKTWELIATGFRNEYDAAFSRDGELFAYDADMEWDMNTPWYRPTRVNHVVSGGEFGWRNGSAKWPSYHEDSLPSIVDIGPGSPTGVCFGYGAKFPAKYQDALFICDWSYGKLYAVHMKPNGSTYTAELEEFVSAQPLPLTDLCVHPGDGALYFNIGGRRTQSGLYRVTYKGDESTAPIAQEPRKEGQELRAIRHQLEAFHGVVDFTAVEVAWPYLQHEDRHIRFAARVAIESQPITAWKDRALTEKDPHASLLATIALIRCGHANLKGNALGNLVKWKWADLNREERLAWTRAVGLFLARMGGFEKDSDRKKLVRRLNKPFPTGDRDLDIELCQLLVAMNAPDIAKRGVAQMEAAPTQEEQMSYAKSLRVLADGWEDADRERYLAWFQKAANFRGGASLGKFVESIKKDAVSHLTEAQTTQFAEVLKPVEPKGPDFVMEPREMVKHWGMSDLEGLLGAGLEGNRDFKNGRNLFGAAACFSCHRFGGEGGAMGPDLTGVAGRFSPKDLLESIIEPSKEISDQYNATVITMKNGDVVMGRIINLSGDDVMVNVNMLDPNAISTVKRPDMVAMEPSKVSMMPSALLDTLKESDILDLLAYLLSGGNPENDLFK
jgi:putative heme-binding domain-containing protein